MLVTKGGYEKAPVGTYHTMLCGSMYSKDLDRSGEKIPYKFTRLEICKTCLAAEKKADKKKSK